MWLKRSLEVSVIALAIVLAFFTSAFLYVNPGGDTRPKDDALHYVAIAYNIAKYGVYTRSRKDDVLKLHPKYKREPGYSTLLAAGLKTWTSLKDYSLDCLLYKKNDCQSERLVLVRINQLSLFALLVLTLFAGRQVTGSWLAGVACLVIVAGGNFFAPTALSWTLYPEILGAFLLLAHSLFGFMALQEERSKTRVLLVLCGVSLGLLVLTKAVFQYWLLLLVLFSLLAIVFRNTTYLGRIARKVAVVAVSGSMIAGGWALRNYVHFDHFAISERGGNVLLLRSMFAKMTPEEYRAAWCAWTPSEIELLKSYLCKDISPGAFDRLSRSSEDPGTFKNMRNSMIFEIEKEVRKDGEVEMRKLEEGVEDFVSGWKDQVKLTPLFAYRGAWVEPQSIATGNWNKNGMVDTIRGGIERIANHVRLLFFPALILLFLVSPFIGKLPLFFFVLPSMYCFAIHSVATHFIPRYSLPLVPVLVVAMVVSILMAAAIARPGFDAIIKHVSRSRTRRADGP